MKRTPQLIILSGLPGAGKSTVAEIISSECSIPVFAKDNLEAALVRSELVKYEHERLGYSGYELLTECARTLLKAKSSVALDSVCGRRRIRDGWRELARETQAKFLVIECICSNENLHRTRLQGRKRQIPGWPELDWEEVIKVKGYYETWDEVHLVIDSCDSIEDNKEKVLQYLVKEIV